MSYWIDGFYQSTKIPEATLFWSCADVIFSVIFIYAWLVVCLFLTPRWSGKRISFGCNLMIPVMYRFSNTFIYVWTRGVMAVTCYILSWPFFMNWCSLLKVFWVRPTGACRIAAFPTGSTDGIPNDLRDFVGTPFGLDEFLSLWSHGLKANVLGFGSVYESEKCLFLPSF